MNSASDDLFDYALARNTDPSTSHDAARSIDQALPHLEKLVLDSIRASLSHGRTLDELIDDTGLDKVTVSPRLRPLCNKRLIVESGKRLGRAGRMQIVWNLTGDQNHEAR